MKFKKLAALSTAVVMSASMLVGCGGNDTSTGNMIKTFFDIGFVYN